VLAPRRVVDAVEERALLVEHEPRPVPVAEELDRRQRHRREPVVEQEVVGEHDPLAVDDVVEAAPERVARPVRRAADVDLGPADAEVELPVRRGEPLPLELGVGERAERLRRRERVAALDREVGVDDAHSVLP
jgi:hypothetical protein